MLTSPIKAGLTHEQTFKVEEKDSAQELGSGLMQVLGTPRLVAMLENTAMNAILPHIEGGFDSVGAHIELSHLAPTAIGKEVRTVAKVERVEGRKIHFHLHAFEGEKLIGRGKHLRVIVDAPKFMTKLLG